MTHLSAGVKIVADSIYSQNALASQPPAGRGKARQRASPMQTKPVKRKMTAAGRPLRLVGAANSQNDKTASHHPARVAEGGKGGLCWEKRRV